MIDSEPEDTDSEASAEPEQEVNDQAEAESKDEHKEQMSSSGESDEERPVPPKKLPARSDEDREKGAEEAPSVVGKSEEEESGSSLPAEQKGSNER
jgi:hypothetical protein